MVMCIATGRIELRAMSNLLDRLVSTDLLPMLYTEEEVTRLMFPPFELDSSAGSGW